MEKRNFVISDIHGCVETFRFLLEARIKLNKSDQLYLLGDYIDRGPSSKEVIDLIIDKQQEGYQIIALKGNHEQLMQEALIGKRHLKRWLVYGGDATMESFGIEDINKLDKKYMDFIEGLEYYVETENCYLVHAGFNFEAENIFDDQVAMLWARQYEVKPELLNNKTLIHGHTPIEFGFITKSIELRSEIIDLDNGCVYTNLPGLGGLCCLNLDTYELIIEANRDVRVIS